MTEKNKVLKDIFDFDGNDYGLYFYVKTKEGGFLSYEIQQKMLLQSLQRYKKSDVINFYLDDIKKYFSNSLGKQRFEKVFSKKIFNEGMKRLITIKLD